MLYFTSADFPHVFSFAVVREFSSFIQTPYSTALPFIFFLLITGCKAFQKELAQSSNPLSCPKVLLEALAGPQAKHAAS